MLSTRVCQGGLRRQQALPHSAAPNVRRMPTAFGKAPRFPSRCHCWTCRLAFIMLDPTRCRHRDSVRDGARIRAMAGYVMSRLVTATLLVGCAIAGGCAHRTRTCVPAELAKARQPQEAAVP